MEDEEMPKADNDEYQLFFRSGGRLLSGTFTIRDGMVFVRSEHGEKPAQIGGSPPEVIARLVLGELAAAARAKRRSPPRRAKDGKRWK